MQRLWSSPKRSKLRSLLSGGFLQKSSIVILFFISVFGYSWEIGKPGDTGQGFISGFERGVDINSKISNYLNDLTNLNPFNTPGVSETTSDYTKTTYTMGEGFSITGKQTASRWSISIRGVPRVPKISTKAKKLSPIASYSSSADSMDISIADPSAMAGEIGELVGTVFGAYVDLFFNIFSPKTLMALAYIGVRLGMDLIWSRINIPYSDYVEAAQETLIKSEQLAVALNNKFASVVNGDLYKGALAKKNKKSISTNFLMQVNQDMDKLIEEVNQFPRYNELTLAEIDKRYDTEILADIIFRGKDGVGLITYTEVFIGSKVLFGASPGVEATIREKRDKVLKTLKDNHAALSAGFHDLTLGALMIFGAPAFSYAECVNGWRGIKAKVESVTKELKDIPKISDNSAKEKKLDNIADLLYKLYDTYIFTQKRVWSVNLENASTEEVYRVNKSYIYSKISSLKGGDYEVLASQLTAYFNKRIDDLKVSFASMETIYPLLRLSMFAANAQLDRVYYVIGDGLQKALKEIEDLRIKGGE